jgi:hypothetical protein
MQKKQQQAAGAGGGGIRVPDCLINKELRLCQMAMFGSPRYDSRVPLHIPE